MTEPIDGRRLLGIAAVAAGVALLANPAWLGQVTIYPGTGWGFLPLFHATLSAVGLVAVAAGAFAIRSADGPPANRHLAALAAATIVGVPLYAIVLAAVVGTGGPAIEGYAYRQAFVASLVVAAFVAGCAIATRRRSAALLAVVVPAAPLPFVVVEWRSGAVLEPVLELHFLLTGNPIGVPYLGPVLFVAALILGYWAGRVPAADVDGGRSRTTGTAPGERPG